MEFPPRARVMYDKNPLAEVVCQLRFPRIFALDDNIPVEFQRLLGADYPFVETQEIAQISIALGSTPPNAATRTQYCFLPEDRSLKITLSSEALSVSTEKYTSWDDFLRHIKNAVDALQSSYPIALFTRVGLRYINVISRNKLGLTEKKWTDLIRLSALGLLAEPEIPIGDVVEFNAAIALKLAPSGLAVLRTGLGQTAAAGEELVFVVDGDFFEEGSIKGVDHAYELCERFHATAGRTFGWLISPELHQALGPRDPD